ncbi:MAG: glycosyltransferase [bacterium]
MLITYIEKRKIIKTEYLKITKKNWPFVDIIVPCFNESKTIIATIDSLLNLIYPKNKLKIIIVNDGSTDDSLKKLEIFEKNLQIKIYHKENGGKHTALNFGIKNSNSDLVGCLDADCFVDKDALKNMLPFFENEKIMAVIPVVKVHNPKNLLQKIQRTEYNWSTFVKEILVYLNALFIIPGTFTIIRRKVFEKIGDYKDAYLTEDLEMALRMQKHNYKIASSRKSSVITITPKTFKTFYKQRLRWAYGFLKNIIDYKSLFFKKEYGHLGFFILPFSVISIIATFYFIVNSIISNVNVIMEQIIKIKLIGFSFNKINFDWFYLNTSLISIIIFFILIISLTLILISVKFTEGKLKIKPELFYFIFLFPIIAPLWLINALFNTIFSRKVTWR